jgi:hypothetical protein
MSQELVFDQFDDVFNDMFANQSPAVVPADKKVEESKQENVEAKTVETETTTEENVSEEVTAKETEIAAETTKEQPTEEVIEAETDTEEQPQKKKRHRRTKAEMEAARAAEAAAKAAEEDKAADEETEEVEEEQADEAEVEEEAPEETEAPAPKKTKNKPTVAATDTPNEITVTIHTNHTYHDIINALNLLPAVDDDFMKTKEEIEQKMNQIVVQSGMDRPNIEIMGQKIDELNAIISGRRAAMKTAYENIASKDDGILMREMAKGSAAGHPFNQSNEAARKANGIVAAENFVSPRTGETIDLYWCAYATRYAKNFYEAAMEQLENKRRLLKQQADFITMHA